MKCVNLSYDRFGKKYVLADSPQKHVRSREIGPLDTTIGFLSRLVQERRILAIYLEKGIPEGDLTSIKNHLSDFHVEYRPAETDVRFHDRGASPNPNL